MEILDLSGNNFENQKLFVDVFKETIFGIRFIKTLIISDNGFDPTIVQDLEGHSIKEVIL